MKKNEIMPFAENGWNRDHHIKWNKPGSQRQVSHAFFHIWNLEGGEGNERTRETIREVEKKREDKKGNGGVNMIKVHPMHTWKGPHKTHYFV
jgi:hypothetical protein